MNFAIQYIAENNYLDILEICRLRTICKDFLTYKMPKVSIIKRRWLLRYSPPRNICYMIVGDVTIIFNVKMLKV